MTPEQFCFWLQGFVEMNPNAMLTGTQWEILKDHLKLVMKKETPNRPYQGPIFASPALPAFPPADVFKSPLVTC